MTFEEALRAYCERNEYVLPRPRNPEKTRFEFENFTVEHEAGWSNDNGTHWPAEVNIYFDVVQYSVKTGKQTGRRRRSVSAYEHDPIEFARELFRQ